MRCIRCVLLLSVIFMATKADSQLWKVYMDSADFFTGRKEYERSVKYHAKANKQLYKDSVNRKAYIKNNLSLGSLLYDLDEYEKAESCLLEAKKTIEKIGEKASADYATVCNHLGGVYFAMGMYEKAEPLFITSMQLREKIIGKEHADYASVYEDLGKLYSNMSLYDKSEYFFLEYAKWNEKRYGLESEGYAGSCLDLGVLYNETGEFEKAESFLLISLHIYEKLFGKQGSKYSNACANLGNLYYLMGHYEKAEIYYKADIAIQKILGKNRPQYAESCGSLANLYAETGQYEKAKDLQLESMDIIENLFSKNHPTYSIACTNLGLLYIDMGQFAAAEPYLLESRKLDAAFVGKDHPDYGTSCFSLAELYRKKGQYKKAESLYMEDRRISEKAFGKEHPSYANNCIRLANLYWLTNRVAQADNMYKEGFVAKYSGLKKVFEFTSESEKQSSLKGFDKSNKEYLSFANRFARTNPGFTYDVALVSRNLILSSAQQLRYAVYHTSDSAIARKYREWVKARELVSDLLTKSIEERGDYLKAAEQRANTLEKELTRLSSAFRNVSSRKDVSWKKLREKLTVNEAAVEFIEFQYYDGKRWTDSIYYSAVVLRKDKATPAIVSLFEKKRLDSLLESTSGSMSSDMLGALYGIDPSKRNSLYNLTWQPIEKHLEGIRTVYFAPAGSLFKISFAALPVQNDILLSDKYRLVQLNTTAAVIDKFSAAIQPTDTIILYGGVEYDVDSATMKAIVLTGAVNEVGPRSLPDDLVQSTGQGFKYLTGTEKEVKEIELLAQKMNYNVKLNAGKTATEESFKKLTGKHAPAILHIATHGFFFPDSRKDKEFDLVRNPIVFKQSENPLVRSGLVLTGANNAWKGKPVTNVEDGILTSYEISNLYFPNTKLAVLSACETGLGDIQGSEGVYGLQRAFKMAGVENLVMSLWKVPDLETAEFMQEFYKNMFAGQTIRTSFDNTQSLMKNRYRNDPYKWAAWILIR